MAKKLLEEATVRRFMKIAGLQPLSENFAQELQEEDSEEEVVEEMYKEEEPGMEAGEMKEAEMPEGDEMPEMEKPEEDEVKLEVEGGKDEVVKLLAKLADMLGVDVEVEGDEMEEPEMEEPEMEEPEAEEMPEEQEGEEEMMEEGEHMEEPAKDPAGHSLESPEKASDADPKDPNQDPKTSEHQAMAPKGEHMAESREAFKKRLVEQVAKRVAARLKELK